MSRIQQDIIDYFTIPCRLQPDVCSLHKHCDYCMQQWQTDISFQLSEAAHLHRLARNRQNGYLEWTTRYVYSGLASNFPLLPILPTCFHYLPHHNYLHLHKPSTLPIWLLFSITAEQRSAVSSQQSAVNCCTHHVNKDVQLSSSASGSCHTDRPLSGGKLLVCGLGYIHTYTVWIALKLSDIQAAQNVRILKHTLLNKLRRTANYKACCYKTSPSQPHVSHLTVSLPSTHTPPSVSHCQFR